MSTESATADITALIELSRQILITSQTADRNRKSLSGTGFYANKFHDHVVSLAGIVNRLSPLLNSIDGLDPEPLLTNIGILKSPGSAHRARDSAQKAIRLICHTEVIPKLSLLALPAVPASEMVLPSAVLATAPAYLRRILLQANGCYEQRWFDACSVMIRKLAESLIIEVYERHHKDEEIKKASEYLMLAGLIAQILGQTYWSLQRETRQELPALKRLGDRAAHSRRYQATKADIDQIRSGFRATVDDLLHLANMK